MAEDKHTVIMLRARFADSIISAKKFRDEVTVTVGKEEIINICRFLKENLQYNLLTDVTAVDYLGKAPRFMMVYHLYSIPNKERLRIKAPVAESDLTIDSLVPIWKSANWLEREVFDLVRYYLSTTILTCAGFLCPMIGLATRFARITRCRGRDVSLTRGGSRRND